MGSYLTLRGPFDAFLSVMCVPWLILYCMSWRLGLFIIENVFVQILVQESSWDMDRSFSFAVGRDTVRSVLRIMKCCELRLTLLLVWMVECYLILS